MATEGMEAGCAFVDGEFVPIDEACVPIRDWGFTRSDLTYDTTSVWGGRFFRLDLHLARFARNCERLALDPGLTIDEIAAVLHGCVTRAGLDAAYVQMICTRGVPTAGSRDPRTFCNRFYAFAVPYIWISPPEQQTGGGVDVVVARDTVRIPEAAFDPRVKNFMWGDLIRGLYEAYDRGGQNVLLPDTDGNVTEGPGFNLFAVIDGVLCTPASGILDGITRRTVLELADEAGIETRIAAIPVADLGRASECFLSSTAGGVMPVRSIDGVPLAAGAPGPVTIKLRDRYWAERSGERWTSAVRAPAGS